MIEEILSSFGFSKYEVNLSTRPEKSVGSDAIWSTAEAALVQALGMKQWDYVVDNGGGAFYGPKIDIKVRTWCTQCRACKLSQQIPLDSQSMVDTTLWRQ